ncbi:MAG: transposase [Pedosphaera sp.]|nr:transposase [Pedosphaera sp.]
MAGVVRSSLQLDPLSGHFFVFSNQRRNRVKILFWDKSGWWLCAKRLESGTLAWPDSAERVIEHSNEQRTLLLSRIDLSQTRVRPWLNHLGKEDSEAHPRHSSF